jgi:hypothetical protein
VSRRALPLVAVLLAVCVDLGLSGCVSLPEAGAVRSETVTDTGGDETLVDYTPAGPRPGSTPVPLVDNFLTAMTATPLNTYVAREFLTPASSKRWKPERGTVVYGSMQLVKGRGGDVMVRLRDVIELDGRGAWVGDPTSGRGHDYRFRVVKADGVWRIDGPPDRLLIPRNHYDVQYQQYLLYFFDQTAQGLVPEPVYLPRGRQASTLLVADLLKGPEPYLRDAERTFLPKGTRLDGISVPVSRSGTAEVPLSDEVVDVRGEHRDRMLAQLAWTLGQIPGVERMRVTVEDTPLDLPGPVEDVGLDEWSEFDPSVAYASAGLFGLRDHRVVALGSQTEERVSGPLGTLALRLRSLAVDLLGQRIAAVTADGRQVLEADRDGKPGQAATPADVSTVYAGTDVLRPSYDRYGQLWVVDRTASGARLSVVRSGRATPLEVPGLSGALVERVTMSRDGTRLVAQVRRAGRDVLQVSRVERDTAGRVLAVGPPRRLSVAGSPGRVIDLGWRGPSELAVLVASAGATARVVTVQVDGSPDAVEDDDTEPVGERAVRLVTSPTGGTPLLVVTAEGRVLSLSRSGRWTRSSIKPGLGAATYVG